LALRVQRVGAELGVQARVAAVAGDHRLRGLGHVLLDLDTHPRPPRETCATRATMERAARVYAEGGSRTIRRVRRSSGATSTRDLSRRAAASEAGKMVGAEGLEPPTR